MKFGVKSLLILGLGYTGNVVAKIAKERGFSSVEGTHRAEFNLHDRNTWSRVDKNYSHTLWTFPAEPLEEVREFWARKGRLLGKLVVVGTTGSYLVQDEEIIEESDLDLESERVRGEEFLQTRGAAIVRAAGIYGPNRLPLRWLKEGRVSANEKWVNLIHVEDLAQILVSALLEGQNGTRYIASDGKPQRWCDLAKQWRDEFRLELPSDAKSSDRPSKRIDPSWTLSQLNVSLIFPSVLEGVRKLMA